VPCIYEPAFNDSAFTEHTQLRAINTLYTNKNINKKMKVKVINIHVNKLPYVED